MKNEAIHNYLLSKYNAIAFTHTYIFGYVANGMVYGALVEDARPILPYITCLDCASSKNGGTIQLKFKPNKAQIALIVENADEVRPICTTQFLEDAFRSCKQNRGQIFETLSANVFGGEQVTAKNAKFTDCGDIIVNGKHIQVKFQKATFTDERTLQNLGR